MAISRAARRSPAPTAPSRWRGFVEKPDPATAERYVASGEYFWNSGIFLFPAALYLEELERLQPDMLAACREALAGARRDDDFIRLDKDGVRRLPGRFDRLCGDGAYRPRRGGAGGDGLERSRLVGRAVGDRREGRAGNALVGNVIAEGAELLSALGGRAHRRARGRGSRRRRDRRRGHAGAAQPRPGRSDGWSRGWSRRAASEADALPRCIALGAPTSRCTPATASRSSTSSSNPARKLSLQMHHHRAEHWVVVQRHRQDRRAATKR